MGSMCVDIGRSLEGGGGVEVLWERGSWGENGGCGVWFAFGEVWRTPPAACRRVMASTGERSRPKIGGTTPVKVERNRC